MWLNLLWIWGDYDYFLNGFSSIGLYPFFSGLADVFMIPNSVSLGGFIDFFLFVLQMADSKLNYKIIFSFMEGGIHSENLDFKFLCF